MSETPEATEPPEDDSPEDDPPAADAPTDGPANAKRSDTQWSLKREVEAESVYASASTVTTIMGDVISGASAVIGNVERPQRGRILNADLSEFATVTDGTPVYATDALKAAQRQLENDRLLVLVGPSDSGKQFAALCVLGQLGHARALGISPAADPQEVTTCITQKKAAYLISGSQMFGRTRTGASSSSARHDMDVLASRLRTRDAYLVVTLHAEVSLAAGVPYAFPWTMPDPGGLFEVLWNDGPPGEHTLGPDEVAGLIEDLTHRDVLTPRLTARLVTLLRDGADPATAREAVRDSSGAAAAGKVKEWFDDEPNFDQVLYLTVVAFLGGLDESTLEWHYEDLRRRFDPESAETGAEDDDSTWSLPPRPKPDRYDRVVTPLLRVSAPGETLIPDRTVDVHSEAHRQAVVEEIWTRWGRDFWGPITEWLAALPASLSVEGADRLARGLACLATGSYSEVLRMLDRWWDRTPLERRCAVHTVSELAGDGRLATAVLRSTIWLGSDRNASLERWWTTDIALGGPLGVAFWPVAVPELWRRVKAETARGPAGLALWNLLAGEQASEELATIILSFLCEQVEAAESDSERRVVLASVMAVLGARFERDEKVARAAAVLGSMPEPRRYLVALLRGALWHHASAARPLVTGMVRHARAVGTRAETVDLLEAVAKSADPERHQVAVWHLQRIIQAVLKGQDLDDEDAVLRRAFSAGTAPTEDNPKGGLNDE